MVEAEVRCREGRISDNRSVELAYSFAYPRAALGRTMRDSQAPGGDPTTRI